MCLRQFLTAEAAREGSAQLESDGYVTCIVPVSVEEKYWWNGRVQKEYPVMRLRDDLMVAHALEAAGVKLDTQSDNDKGIPTLGRTKGE